MTRSAAIIANGLSVGYATAGQAHTVCGPLDVTLQRGELVCLLGPNGAGKCTLMSTLAGILPPLTGSVHLGDAPLARLSVRDRARRLAIVTTERVDAPGLTGYALVALGRYPHTGWFGSLTPDDTARVEEAIALAGAEAFRNRLVGELSDGERQRLMLARALAQAEDVLILDELTAFLDLPRRVETMRTLRRLARDAGRAVLLSTHDLDLALRSADQIWLLPRGGPLRVGVPEALVLDGAFADAFRTEGVEFDMVDGSFHVRERGGRAATVVGSGAPGRWTARALERRGWVIREDAEVSVTISDTLSWTLTREAPSPPQEGEGLDSLLAVLGEG